MLIFNSDRSALNKIKQGTLQVCVEGFTLIEVVAVLVILAITTAVGSQYFITALDAYRDTHDRSRLVQKGRIVLEQMTRQLRVAVPNSVRVSTSGNCIEFLPIVAATNYLDDVPDSVNGAAGTTTVITAPMTMGTGGASHVVIGGAVPGDIYAVGAPTARVLVGAMGAGLHTNIPLASTHTFIRNSINKRVFIADNPKRFCLQLDEILQYSDYGLDTASVLSDANPGGSTAIMSRGVHAHGTPFSLSAGGQDRNISVMISLEFSEGSQSIALKHQVLVRNVP